MRLDKVVQTSLEQAARERGIGLSTYLRELATEEAKRLRRERIRVQSRLVGEQVDARPDSRESYADWGTPTAEIVGR